MDLGVRLTSWTVKQVLQLHQTTPQQQLPQSHPLQPHQLNHQSQQDETLSLILEYYQLLNDTIVLSVFLSSHDI